MNEDELQVLQRLDRAVRRESIVRIVDAVAWRVEQKMCQNPEQLVFWEPLPLAVYGRVLPEVICSSWVFVLRADANTEAERHPNSHQRMMSYRGCGDLQVWSGKAWYSHLLASDIALEIEKRWVSIPPNTWHRAVVPGENWVVVSFHTVTEDELIEERCDPSDVNLTRQHRYLEQ